MTTSRRLIALATALVLGGALAACSGGGGSSSAGKTLDVLVSANTVYPDQQRQWFKDVADRFKKDTGSTVNFETFASSNDELTKIQTSVLAGEGPDIFSLGTTFTPTAYATGAFLQLSADDWTKIGGRDRFVPATLGISGPDQSHQVGIPFASRPFVMAYNKDLLAAAGIDKPATTWDELREQAKRLTGKGVYGLAVAYADNYDPWKFIWAMSAQAGVPLVDGGKARLDDPAVRTAYQTYLGWLATDHVVDPAATGWKNPQALAAFGQGKAGYMLMTTSTARNSLDRSAIAGRYSFALMPTVPPGVTATPAGGTPAASILSGDNLVVARYTRNKDLALRLVNLLTSADMQTTYYHTFGDLPTNADAARSLASDPALTTFVDSASKSFGTPFTGAWSQIQIALVNVVVQSIPDLSAGRVDAGRLTGLIGQAQQTAQTALAKAK